MFALHIIALLGTQTSIPLEVTNGIYEAENGLKMQLLGIANSEKKTEPLDAFGKPLSASANLKFEMYGDVKLSQRPWDKPRKGNVSVYAVFALFGPKESTHGIYPVRPFHGDMERYSPAEPEKGRSGYAVAYRFDVPADSETILIPLQHPSGPYAPIATFSTKGICSDSEFKFALNEGSVNAVSFTQKKKETVKQIVIEGLAKIPLKFQGCDFDLALKGETTVKKSEDPFPMDLFGACEDGKDGDFLKLRIFGRFLPKKSGPVELILQARPLKKMNFILACPK